MASVSRPTGTPTGGGFDVFVNELDYILVYSKTGEIKISGTEFDEADANIYDREDEKGKYLIRSLRRTGGEDRREDRPTMFYGVFSPDGTEVFPMSPLGYESRWICGYEKYKEMESQGLIEWQNKSGEWKVYQKFYLEGRKKQPSNLWSKIEGNKKATRDIRDLFNSEKVFDFPKPIGLLINILQVADVTKTDIILDFFAGSGTTGHAVMAQNAADSGNRQFILVQLPEPLDPAKSEQKTAADFCDSLGVPRNIAELTKERLRRAGAKVKAEVSD